MKPLKALAVILLIIIIYGLPLYAQTKIFSSTRAQIEPYIAVNPTNPNNLIGVVITEVSSNQFKIGYYYSTNAGQSWTGNENTYGTASEGDPVVVFDNDGTAYVFYQVLSANSFYMRKSTDGGITWQPALSTQATLIFSEDPGNQLDKPWVAASPVRNSQSGYYDIYLSYTSTNKSTTNQIVVLLKLTNGGNTFTNIYAATPGTNLDNNGTYVETGPNGEIYFCWATLARITTPHVQSISAVRSADGGQTFGNAITIPATQIGVENRGAGYKVKGAILVDSYPRLAVDKSGQYMGNVYLVWSDNGTSTNADIKMIKGIYSGGIFSWQTTPIINVDASAGEQWMPAISVNPDGVVSVLYYSSGINRLDPIYTYVKYSTDGGTSFSAAQNVGSSSGFTISSSGDVFLGDYHGSSAWFGKAHSIFCEYRTDPTYNARQIYYNYTNLPSLSAPANYQKVVVDQKDENNQSFESFSRWNQGQFTSYVAPSTFIFPLNSGQVIKAKQDFKQGTYQKYNNWNLATDITNHHSFNITSGIVSINSNFKTSQTGVTIKNQLLESASVGDGTIYFADPWLIDYNDLPYGMRNQGTGALPKPRLSPFYPDYSTYYGSDVYKGIFLNQPIVSGQPYYSIQAQSTQTINGYTSYFQNWNASGANLQSTTALTTPVVFTSAGATVTANYKGHLISNTTTGFSTNCQRKVVSDDTGYKHMVYESMGNIWYTRSTDNGATWSAEQKVNIDGSGAKSPSIACANDGNNLIYIVYQSTVDQSGFATPSIILSQFRTGTLNWRYLVTNLSSYDYNTNPVVSSMNNIALVVYKGSSSEGLTCKDYIINGSPTFNITASYSRILPNTDANSVNPSLASDRLAITPRNFLAYQNGTTEIRYLEFFTDLNNITTYEYNVISSGSGFTNNTFPSLSTHLGDPIVSWTAYSQYMPGGIIRRKVNGNWSTFTSTGGTQNYSNNNSTQSGTDGSIIAWRNFYDNSTQFRKLENGVFSSIMQIPTGAGQGEIQISNGFTFSQIKATIFNSNGSAPYQIIPLPYDFYYLLKGGLNLSYGKIASVVEKGIEYVYFLGDIKVDDINIKFKPRSDTLLVKDANDLETAITTGSFLLTANSKFEFTNFRFVINGEKNKEKINDQDEIRFAIELVKAGSDEVKNKFEEISFNRSQLNQDKTTLRLDCSNIIEGVYYLKVSCKVSGEASLFVNDIQYEDNTVLSKENYKETAASNEIRPSYFYLGQNYPNPFNPSTTINYQIPKDGLVILKVYDTLGREVKTLVNGYQTVGSYSVKFDASKLPSGVYVYQIRSGDYTNSRKMLLVK